MDGVRFTGAEGGARLAVAVRGRNSLVALTDEHAAFVTSELLREDAYRIRGLLSAGRQRSVYVARASRVPYIAYNLDILTDLKVVSSVTYDRDWTEELEVKEVLVATSGVVRQLLEDGLLSMRLINILILESCHRIHTDADLQTIMEIHAKEGTPNQPRILALTYPLFSPRGKENQPETVKENGNINSETLKTSSGECDLLAIEYKVETNITVEEVNDTEIEEDKIIELDSILEKCTTSEQVGNEIDNSKTLENNVILIDKDIEQVIENYDLKKVESSNDSVILNAEAEEVVNDSREDTNEGEDLSLYEKLEWKIEELEKKLSCTADLAEDIDSVKRLSATVCDPRELIIQYGDRPHHDPVSTTYIELEKFMRDTVEDVLRFIYEHRYDPTEIYGDDAFTEELKGIPDPTLDPKEVFHQFLYILDELGPYGADKAAISLVGKIEKLKVKTPYERHFLLLCACTSVFLKIRCYTENVFQSYTEWEKIKMFSTSKIKRFVEVLEQFKPNEVSAKSTPTHVKKDPASEDSDDKSKISIIETDEIISVSKCLDAAKLLDDIEKCDFKTLSNQLADKVNIMEANLPEIHEIIAPETNKSGEFHKQTENVETNTHILDNTANTEDIDINIPEKGTDNDLKEKSQIVNADSKEVESISKANALESKLTLGFSKRSGPRNKGRGRQPRQGQAARALQMQQNPDALCGIVFMKEPLMARVLFMIVVELSRSHPSLGFLCAQYTGEERPADQCEPRELERQRRKQEDVLKKFRMHECNLLLATSSVEEGIDLPRCNLVLRWDPPNTYRSYSVCRSRARAPRAACALLARDQNQQLLHNIAVYKELDQMLSRKCGCGIQDEPPLTEEDHANRFAKLVKPYTPEHRAIDVGQNIIDNLEEHIDDPTDETNIDNEKTEGLDNEKSDNLDNKKSKTNEKCKNFDDSIGSNGLYEANFSCISKSDSNVQSEIELNGANEKCAARIESDIKVSEKIDNELASVDLNSAISLINRYCGKLPSDTFTRLAPQWWIEEFRIPNSDENDGGFKKAYVCTLRLPLNCPVKYNIVGHPMPTRVLARRMVALQACRVLHRSAELDNNLMPIGKENFKSSEAEYAPAPPGDSGAEAADPARPGTTKRRQYYYKRTAWSFTDCQPVQNATDEEIEARPRLDGSDDSCHGDNVNMLYAIISRLSCALPERYNTRGRRLHVPQTARQGLGVLTSRRVDKIPAFPVYTRSGEVRVSVEHIVAADTRVSPRRANLVRRFMKFVFADVLRVRRRGMHLSTEGRHNNYYVVPTYRSQRDDGSDKIDIDWEFLELIYEHTEKINSDMERTAWAQDTEKSKDQNVADDDRKNTIENIKDINSKYINDKVTDDINDMQIGETNAKVENIKDKSLKIVSDESNDGSENGLNEVKNARNNYEYTKEHHEIEKNVKAAKAKSCEEVKKELKNPLLQPGETFVFDPDKYREAVVTPWYRNQDQPQFFLVAEICWQLSPESAFPSAAHTTFRHYYTRKYGVALTQSDQPLLEVDHTSARLNLLTPRYVNRKGVALPVSSERTRRAKRDRLDQKQILVPELCRVHPFAAPLWFVTVALPCVLYRINALLIADEIRRAVAVDIGLGTPEVDKDFEWPPLDFGWSLAEVLSVDEAKTEQDRSEQEQEEQEDTGEMIEEEERWQEEREKTLNEILQEKEDAESGFEIGTWSNDMASSVPDYDELLDPLPPNLTFCTSASGGANWSDSFDRPCPAARATRTFSVADSDCSYISSDLDTDDSSLDSESSLDDADGFARAHQGNARLNLRIEYRTAHEAEALEVSPARAAPTAPAPDPADDRRDRAAAQRALAGGDVPQQHIEKFHQSVEEHKRDMVEKGLLITKDDPITTVLPPLHKYTSQPNHTSLDNSKQQSDPTSDVSEALAKLDLNIDNKNMFKELFPYGTIDESELMENGNISIETIEKSKRILLDRIKKSLTDDEVKEKNCFSMVDVDIDSPDYVNEKIANVGFDNVDTYMKKMNSTKESEKIFEDKKEDKKEFDFDYQPKLEGHPGPSPSVILQALTMSNANDGINLERLETIGDSFLKLAITAYLYCAQPTVHEGKLSHMRSKQVSNLNLYRLGRTRRLGARMIASKFEPHDNWLPPCHRAPPTATDRSQGAYDVEYWRECPPGNEPTRSEKDGCFIPYNLITQHSIPDKSVADCVEALIGAYLIECGPRGALLFMSWLGIKVLPRYDIFLDDSTHSEDAELRMNENRVSVSPSSSRSSLVGDGEAGEGEGARGRGGARRVGALRPRRDAAGRWKQTVFGELRAPPSPLLRYIDNADGELEQMLSGYDQLERTLRYRFRDRSLLLQAMTHASHQQNRLTDCYQRLEFLGDAILDYLITRHLYEDSRRHSPGALTDLRSALVNNTIFATLAVRHGFHRHFRHTSPALADVLARYVAIQEENGHSISEEHYLIQEDEMEQAEDVEVPKALGDLFESVAGAIYLDSGMSLGAVWRSYGALMGAELEAFSAAAPKSPVRELLEAEPDTAKFGKPERLADGRRVRVCVEVFGRGTFKGVGRNYRIAKGTAARCALRHLKKGRRD